MAIPQSRYVEIISGVIGASGVAQRALVGRRFTTNPLVPVGAILQFSNLNNVAAFFGTGSTEYAFAAKYFGYTAPAPVSKASSLQFAAHAPAGRAPAIYGSRFESSLAVLQGVSAGVLNIRLGDNEAQLAAIDLTGATSLANVASLVQSAIRAVGGAQYAAATVTYDPLSTSFRIVGDTVGPADAVITPTASPSDLATLLNLAGGTSMASPGVAAQTMLDAFLAAESISDSFGSASFETQPDIAQVVQVSEYVAAANVKYQFYAHVTPTTYSAFYGAMVNNAGTGLQLNKTAGQYMEAFPAAIMAATDYQRRNATVNYMFRRGNFVGEVTSEAEANLYDAARVNYYGVTSNAGQNIAFYQRGFLLGTSNDPLDMNVYANEQWLKAKLVADLLNLQLAVNKIPANVEGTAMIRAEIMQAVDQAKFNGTISLDKELSATQKNAIFNVTGDPEAWQDVQQAGFWLEVVIEEYEQEPSGVQSFVAKYTLVYSKNDVVRKIEGSHNLV